MTQREQKSALTRRQALARLGLVTTAVYAAPVLLELQGAHAKRGGKSGGSGGSGGSRPSRGKGSGGSK
ncbi:MAG: hypothetical protein HOO00_06470 [Rhodospirillaceae bacterium]|jgi:hypothetical protein|nr:hypothetical protein [Rhodospirillaceae bacterium]MBT5373661.1 hypothetical protein [Rhodospirillaceae bacterium]MBT5659382.1 hypothetical protein [Rhodospirillaceae bacterium]MBT5752501.1 hypothetical protein [Rhodospirillaceae bacterium]